VLTTRLRGTKARAVGLLEFGGTRPTSSNRDPRRRSWGGGGHPTGRVTAPRTYRAQRFLQGAVDAKRPQIADEIRDQVIRAFANAASR
jgi:hypothetical protein